jgi:hypothetical protein
MLEVYIVTSFSVLAALAAFLVKSAISQKRQLEMVKNFDSYATLLEYYMSKAYEIIYKERILVYSLEGMKIDEQTFSVCCTDFANLVLKLIGPKLTNELSSFYGDRSTLFFNILQYFQSRIEDDAVREKIKEQIMSSELEVDSQSQQSGAAKQ